MDRTLVFEVLKKVGSAVAQMLGPSCEVLLHDTNNPEESIIWVEGDVTGRQIGGPLTSVGLAALRGKSPVADKVNYRANTPDGLTLKSSTVFLRDETGQVFGIFCVNIDLSSFVDTRRLLDQFIHSSEQPTIVKSLAPDTGGLLELLIEEGLQVIGSADGELDSKERLKLVEYLDERGLFQIRNSVPLLASRLNLSRYTIYGDLKKLQEQV